MSNLLFICSKNQWRSPTADALFKNNQLHAARSAGTSDKARIKVSQKHLDWADVVFVMERKHKQLLLQRLELKKPVIILNIEDSYRFDNPKLIELLQVALKEYL